MGNTETPDNLYTSLDTSLKRARLHLENARLSMDLLSVSTALQHKEQLSDSEVDTLEVRVKEISERVGKYAGNLDRFVRKKLLDMLLNKLPKFPLKPFFTKL